MGLVNDKRKGLLLRFNNAVKSLISTQQNIFEGLNIRYFRWLLTGMMLQRSLKYSLISKI